MAEPTEQQRRVYRVVELLEDGGGPALEPADLLDALASAGVKLENDPALEASAAYFAEVSK